MCEINLTTEDYFGRMYHRGDKMKAVLCAINSKFVHSSLSVWYLSAAIFEALGEAPAVLEHTINEDEDVIYKDIVNSNPDVVMFSTYIWNKTVVSSLAKRLKEEIGVTVILGGPEVSYNQEEILTSYPFVDYVISGEGEEPTKMFMLGVPPEKISGFSYKTAGGVVVNPPQPCEKDPPNPYTQEYFERLNGRMAYIETSRGCPYHCAFCLSGRCSGVRFFDTEESKRRILLLANSGTQTVKFIDRTFNADRKRARELFSFMIDNYGVQIPKNVRFHFEIEGELIDEGTVEVLRKAPKGLFQFEIGLQSFNQNTLRAINRRCDADLLCNNVRKILELENIHVHIDLIVGLPYEDMNSLEISFNRAHSLSPHMLQIGFLKLLYGTELRGREEELKLEFTDTPPYQIISTPWLSNGEMYKLKGLGDVFEKMYNSKRFGSTCVYLSSKFISPFQMYMGLSEYVKEQKIPNTLDCFTEAIYKYFSAFEFVNEDELRDCLAIDRLATNRMGTLPEFLKIHSPKIKTTLNELEKNPQTRSSKGVKRAATLLSAENKLVYVDYRDRDLVTERFAVNIAEVFDK